ncbi:MAG TPA: hypothetical protein VHE59_21060 [Mucilaginibacter sp.]|nr:hypothetical protein [Mucilaginibacter sp.]
MDLNFQVTASGRSDAELQERIDNRQKYLPDTIEASLEELQNRGHSFSEEELQAIQEDIQAHRDNALMADSRPWVMNGSYRDVIVDDTSAPSYYSSRVIYIFSILFGTLFGSIMLAMNVNRTENPAGSVGIIFFGLFCTLAQAFIIAATGSNLLNIPLLVLGAATLHSFFWKRYIGDSTFYRTRPIWVPLIIGILLSGLVIGAYIYNLYYPVK